MFKQIAYAYKTEDDKYLNLVQDQDYDGQESIYTYESDWPDFWYNKEEIEKHLDFVQKDSDKKCKIVKFSIIEK